MNLNVTLTLLCLILVGIATGSVPCKAVQFIFGDSLSDVGNNKYLSRSLATANLPYYGIDFGNGLPNGRFTNGLTVADIIGDKTGLPRPPAFLDPSLTEDVILENGLNYASGGGGILNETGGYFIQRLSLWKQIELFRGTKELITDKLGDQAADKFFHDANYVVALGSNDFINNYLMPVLHSLGARKLMVFGLGPMGCIPLQRVLSTSGQCQDRANKLALSFNKAATQLLSNMQSRLPDANFKFGDAYDVVDDVIRNPEKYGFSNADSPCCSLGRIRPALTCIPASTLCSDRSKYVFWDEYHPSDSANQLIANELIKKVGFLGGHSNAPAPAPESAIAPSPDEE
ncbi:GDSL esterase/lipase [Hibiscus syriacus]|uniref:GDSL esterase/lipase n=1 Tax=Hibiscus syriacus TaxID=106335 RepID=A0A6A2WIV5_HIBSY|nr:GDSL esterase/lipase [Hibiscus syriacus]